ncbi:heavy metal sensor histidine kinase [Thauera sp. Sel9]|uniref:heavy metal sensor histidine kinase n=1 Tax=Betaproteobacteria TaxID=28216 RepID=UPI001EB79142|nr:heavy metal sensor histidine kinase [Thauera sp. Sel9]MBK6869707.1 heavy metal sensor histidine kinase [Burkholderiales bacterium]MBS0598470.1 heavy metal sensor histidine kinase [Pseudomonadota bacterium]MBY4599672.1 heavy metal sensor histidine kinase [Ottowia caeni]HPU09185.1 heavy metal sensor histidine kinase [Ottowia sp.]HQZ02707.1 heavy metal sensor histidine kinase [Thauera sp.]
MKKKRAGSLGRRLARWMALLTLAGLALTCLGVYTVTALSFQDRQNDTLRQQKIQVSHLIAEVGGPDFTTLTHKLDDAMVGRRDVRMTLTGPNGRVIYASGNIPSDKRTIDARFEISNSNGSIQALLSLDASEDDRVLKRLAQTLIAAALAGAVVIAIGGYTLVQIGLEPVRDLSSQIQALEADNLHHQLDGSAQPDELVPLVFHVNGMLERLHTAYEQLEAFNADVAHELFTPLATLMGSTEIALRKARDVETLRDVLGDHLEDLQRMSMIVQDMLFLSQADRGAEARRESVDSLARLVNAVADLHEAAIEDAGLQLQVDGDAACAVDIRLLQRALSNLIGNATRHALPQSTIVVKINRHDAEVALRVVNQGNTIPDEHLPYLFNRFYRVDSARTEAVRNHGLGLAIVSAIARMHRGRTLAESRDGVTSIGFVLPD